MKEKNRSSRSKQMPAGTKLYKRTLKSKYGHTAWREYFKLG